MLIRSIPWVLIVCVSQSVLAQEPVSWGPDMHFSTFSIAAIDPETRESGVAVTTRVACVGNAVPWVRAGVGAVATQASTRVEYGTELLDFIESGMNSDDALARAVAVSNAAPPRPLPGAAAEAKLRERNLWGAANPAAGPGVLSR